MQIRIQIIFENLKIHPIGKPDNRIAHLSSLKSSTLYQIFKGNKFTLPGF